MVTRIIRPFAVVALILLCTFLLVSCGDDTDSNEIGDAEQALIDSIDEEQSNEQDSEMSDFERMDAIAESACTLAEAQDSGGLYVKDGETFYPLLEAIAIDYKQGGNRHSDVYQHPEDWDSLQGDFVPELDDNMQIAYFSDDYMPNQICASPILKDGHTIYTSFVKDPEDGKIEANSNIDVETINGESLDDYVLEHGESGEGRIIVVDLDYNQTVSLEHHEGTKYIEDVETANVKWFLADGHIPFNITPNEEMTVSKEELGIELTNEGYAVIDASGLKPGMFYIWDDSDGAAFRGHIFVFQVK